MYNQCQTILCGCLLVLILLASTASAALTNVARGRTAYSSGHSSAGKGPGAVIDGVTEDTTHNPSSSGGRPSRCDACFLSASTAPNQHWRVNLGRQYFITQVNIYTGSTHYSMRRVAILTRRPGSPYRDPSTQTDEWNEIYYSEDSTWYSEISYTPDTAVYAHYVAVLRKEGANVGGLVLTEVEVYGYAPGEFKPTDLRLIVTSDCVTLTWDHPYHGKVTEYQYKCGSESWKSSGKTRIPKLCGISPSAGMSCKVRVSDVVYTEVSTQITCSDIEIPQPTDLSFGTPAKVKHSGRWRYRYDVTWSVPPTYTSCLHSTNPYILKVDSFRQTNRNTNSWTLYRDGYDYVTVTVWVRNKDGDTSTPATESIRVPVGLPPQVAPRNFQLTAVSPTCVSLSWNPVQYPNGPTNGIVYQHNCNSLGWKSIPNDKRVCGFKPNSLVSCNIRARRGSNSDGNRNSEETGIKNTKTCSTDPFGSSSLQFNSPTQESHSGRKRWKYTVSWQVSPPYSCGTTSPKYRLEIDGNRELSNSSQTSHSFSTDGYVGVTVKLWLVYKTGELSTPATKSITADTGLPPQVAPSSFQLTAVSPYCITINSWDPVLYPNGPESGIVYQIKCKDSTWSAILPSKQVCGYRPYELARCEIRARRESNSNGNRNSETAESDVRTHCVAPDLPTDLSTYITQEKYKPVGEERRRIRVKFNIPSGAITSNCASLKSRRYKLQSTTEYNDNNKYIYNLSPVTLYKMDVRAVNNQDMERVVIWEFNTIELEPYTVPVILRNVSHNQSCVSLSWSSPAKPNGVITRYQHRYFLKGNTESTWMLYNSPKVENTYISCGYEAGDLVTYQVRAGTNVGYGPEATGDIRVTCGYPSIPEFQAVGGRQSAEKEKIQLNITWKVSDPACESILYYDFTLKLNSQKISHSQLLPDDRKVLIQDLDPYTNYTLILIAVNDAMNHSSSEPRYITTPQLAPSGDPVLDIEFTSSCANLTIGEPSKPNGVITHYQYTCDYADTETSSYTNVSVTEVQPHTVCGFRSAEKIECRASAINIAGESSVAMIAGYTSFELTSSEKAALQKSKNSGKVVPITVYPVTIDNKKPSAYRFVVNVLDNVLDSGTARNKRSIQPAPDCKLDESTTCYITADVDSSLVDSESYLFTVGDGKEYGGYHNVPLKPSQNYRLYQAVIVTTKDGTKLVQYFEDPIEFYLEPSCNTNCVIAVSVSVSIVVLVAAAVGLFFFLRRYRGKSADSKQVDGGTGLPLDSILASAPVYSAVKKNRRPATNKNDVYEDFNLTCITVSSLESRVRQTEGIEDEYQKLQSLPKPTMTAALLDKNKGKCRYKGLYPADDTRVIIERDGGDDSDFINASYIEGYSQYSTGYVAAQGPTKKTIDDFWLMIWQQRLNAAVMVTNVIEDDKVKCEQYWPDDDSTQPKFNGLSVNLVSEEQWADYVVRVLKVEKDGECRTVRQFHYISWPDHGVPDNMGPFICFYRKVMMETTRLSSPLLVHCSAGVGRTGTFIAMTNLLEQAKSEERVDFYECVKKMRESRPSMVQTVEQYVFLHQVVSEFLVTDKYISSPNSLPDKISDRGNDTELYSNTAVGVVDAEFARIEEVVKRYGLDVEEGKKAVNANKNRDKVILPPSAPSKTDKGSRDKSLRPWLSDSTDDYINAVFVNAYRKQNQFIATQLPLSNTLADFWQMMEFNRITTIIQLEDANEEEGFCPSSDDEKPMLIGEFVVTRLTEEVSEEITAINLRVTRANTSRDVHVIKTKSWTGNGFPQNSSMLCYLEALERNQQKSGNGSVCVTSLDGGARCGMFICAHNAIEKLKCEQEVDLYSTVVTARLRRPQFVDRLVHYVRLYELLREYTDKFSDYANFK